MTKLTLAKLKVVIRHSFSYIKILLPPHFRYVLYGNTILQTSPSVPRRTFGRKYTLITPVPWIRRLVASRSSQTLGFPPRSGRAGFVVDKSKLGEISVRVL